MAVVIDPAGGALAQAFGNLGNSIAGRVFARRNREDALRRDPQSIQQLVPAFEAAVAQGPEAVKAIAESIGVREDFINNTVAGFDPSAAQRTQEAAAQTAESQARVTLAEEEGAILTAQANREFTEEFLALNGPRIQAQAAVKGEEFNMEKFDFESGLIQMRRDSGVDEIRFNTEAIKAAIGGEAAQKFMSFVESLPPNSDERVVALAGLSGSGAAGALASMRNADLSALLRQATVSQESELAMLNLSFELQDRMNSAVDRLAEAEEDGRDKDFIEQAKVDVDNMRLLSQALMEQGKIIPFDLPTVEGRRGKIDLGVLEVSSDEVKSLLSEAAEAVQGGMSVEEIQRRAPGLISDLSPREREEFTTKLPQVIELINQRDQRGSFIGGATEAARAGLLGSQAQTTINLVEMSAGKIIELIDSVAHLLSDADTAVRSMDPNR